MASITISMPKILFFLVVVVLLLANPIFYRGKVLNGRGTSMIEELGNSFKTSDTPVKYEDKGANMALSTNIGAKCLDFDNSFDELVASSGSVYIHMPSKAAGSTFQTFVSHCVGMYDSKRDHSRHVFSTESIEERIEVFLQDSKHPRLMTSHVVGDAPLIRLFETTPRDSLIIYIYREETDRLKSAVKHVTAQNCVGNRRTIPSAEFEVDDEMKCVFNEAAIANLIFKPKMNEVRGGASDIMTCDFYKKIEAEFPKMVFMNYKQANNVQRALAKHHCPAYDKVIHKEHKTDAEVFVKLHLEGEVVTLDEWWETKHDKIEWTFGYKGEDQCRGKTRKLEDDLFACKDEILQVTKDTSF